MIALKYMKVKEIAADAANFAHLIGERSKEVAQIIGEPIDARNAFTDLVNLVADTRTVAPTEFVYYHTARIPGDKATVITDDGIVTQRTNSLIAPSLFTFIDVSSNEEMVKITDLARRKENIMARVNETINDAINSYEIQYVVGLMAAGASVSGNQVTLGSGIATFQFQHVIQMLQQVNKYGDKYVLLMGTTVYQDFLLWDWTDNKNQNIKTQFNELGITAKQIPAWEVDVDGSTKYQMVATKAYLVATRVAGNKKPVLFVRRQLGEIANLLGVQSVAGDVPERLVLQSMNPVSVGNNNARTLSIALVGYEQVVGACVNVYGVSEFSRS